MSLIDAILSVISVAVFTFSSVMIASVAFDLSIKLHRHLANKKRQKADKELLEKHAKKMKEELRKFSDYQ